MFVKQLACLALLPLAIATATGARRKTCVVPYSGGHVDDAPAFNAMVKNCSTNATILFREGINYQMLTPIDFGTLNNVDVELLGNIYFPKNITYVQTVVNASASNKYWISMAGTNVVWSGNPLNPFGGIVNGFGQPWYEAAPNTLPLGGLVARPHTFNIAVSNSTIRWIKVEKPIGWVFHTQGNNNHWYGIRIDASYDLAKPSVFPFNTDGWDVSGNNILIEDSWVFNGDDCVAVNSGNNITFRNNVCIGGHGSSVSSANGVTNVLFKDITMIDSLYATRFKSKLNAVGNVSNVTWENILVQNCTYPVFATGIYFDQNTNRGVSGGQTIPANATSTHITSFTWKNIAGTINDTPGPNGPPGDGSCTTNPCWYGIANITNTAGVTLQLLNQTATNIQVRDVHLVPQHGRGHSNVLCDPKSFIDGTKSLGFQCQNGPFKAT